MPEVDTLVGLSIAVPSGFAARLAWLGAGATSRR